MTMASLLRWMCCSYKPLISSSPLSDHQQLPPLLRINRSKLTHATGLRVQQASSLNGGRCPSVVQLKPGEETDGERGFVKSDVLHLPKACLGLGLERGLIPSTDHFLLKHMTRKRGGGWCVRFQREGQGRWRLDPLEDKRNGTSESTSDGCDSLGLPSLRGFGLLAFALLVFLFQAVDVRSQQIGVSLGSQKYQRKPLIKQQKQHLRGEKGKKKTLLKLFRASLCDSGICKAEMLV